MTASHYKSKYLSWHVAKNLLLCRIEKFTFYVASTLLSSPLYFPSTCASDPILGTCIVCYPILKYIHWYGARHVDQTAWSEGSMNSTDVGLFKRLKTPILEMGQWMTIQHCKGTNLPWHTILPWSWPRRIFGSTVNGSPPQIQKWKSVSAVA